MSTFYYFGFGSNLLAKRIHLQNPSAKRIGAGKLQNYRLDFHTVTSRWQGAPATIVEDDKEEVYGAIWEIHTDNLKDLDKQEGVQQGVYVPITVPVWCLSENKVFTCRAYHLKQQPVTRLKDYNIDDVPTNRQPSLTYLKTLVQGAMETGVPKAYVDWLSSVKHNGAIVPHFEQALQLHVQLNTCTNQFL